MKGIEHAVAAVTRRLERTWHLEVTGVEQAWPHLVPLGKPTSRQLLESMGELAVQIEQLRAFAAVRGARVVEAARLVGGTPQSIPTHLDVPSVQVAAGIAGHGWPQRLERARQLTARVHAELPEAEDVPAGVRALEAMSDVDADLTLRAAAWFALHGDDAAGLTPRQVPVPGLHAKWLNTRHALVAALAGRAASGGLGLAPAHPARVHVTYLDPGHLAAGGRRHDCFSVGDRAAPPYRVQVALITENKDTAIAFPPVPGAVTLEGEGRGAGAAAALTWLHEVPDLVYWGDLDQDGLEILNEYRAAGLAVRSILTDLETYERYRAWGSERMPNGTPVPLHPMRPVPHLSADELALYEHLSDPDRQGPPRIEQERIPLAHALAALTAVSAQARPCTLQVEPVLPVADETEAWFDSAQWEPSHP